MVVREELQRLGAEVLHIELGYAEIKGSSPLSIDQIEVALRKFGFTLIRDKDSVLVEEIKVKIIEYLNYLQNNKEAEPLSVYLSRSLGRNYGYISSHFSKLESRTIEKYLILQKIERVKELLDYDELTLGEIASQLGYSSVHYLSAQFKKVTGVSVSSFRKNKVPKRKYLDNL
jgi:YesN/AraC family two-component response regulator